MPEDADVLQLNGIFPPIPTAFDAEENLLPGRLQENLAHLSRFGLAGFLVLGSNGEKVMLTDDEKRRVYEAARAAIPRDKLMLAGAGEEATRATVRMTRWAAEAGADAVLVLNPGYYKGLMRREALLGHYRTVAESSPVPVVIYNMPACTGADLGAELVIELAAHPNIIGLKDSGGNITKMADIVRGTGPAFQVLAGSAGFLLPALSIGAAGGILALANIAPRECLAVYEHYRSGDPEKARAAQFRLIPLNAAVTSGGGVAALKAAMDHLGLYGGPARRPILPPGPDERKRLLALVDASSIAL
ncbi:MAG TPA: dihydrodipicolinate synthase family protein [candidate division Zixibacteria bacterium]|nr:dihydrodipicolinate synthase family protein [candidate division Zixibacteria bacterium]